MDAESSPRYRRRAVATVRAATPRDAEAIWQVHTDSIRVLCRERYGSVEIAAWIAVRDPESYRLAMRSRELFVAERERAIVGFGQLDSRRGEVEACYVAPDAVGSGVGSALLARMEEVARQLGHASLRLNSTLNAEPFYASRGYRRLGSAIHRVSPKVELACVRMEKTFS